MTLSKRQRQILGLLATGATNAQIANSLGLTTNSVKTHMKALMRKLEVVSRTEAVAVGFQRGLLELEVRRE